MLATNDADIQNQNLPTGRATFGLPFIILYRGTDYLFYRLGSPSVEPYHWFFFITIDVVVMFVVSTMWWTFCRDREIASRKPKD
jgi:hypothetical protein